MANSEADQSSDRVWSERVANIAIATIEAAIPRFVEFTDHQRERCKKIMAEEIHVRLMIGDRPMGEGL